MHTIRRSTARLPLYIPRFAASHWASPPDKKIDELRKENETLKLQLIVLKADREDMKANFSKLYARNARLDARNARLELQISKINAGLERQDRDDKIRKLQISIQDLNSKEEFEKICSPSVRQNLARLRSPRNMECHYLDDRDSASLTEYKEHILLDQLKNVSYPVALQFEALFGTGLLEEIERILDRKLRGQGKIAISGEDQARVEMWWGL